MTDEPERTAPGPELHARMSALRRRDNTAEVELRRALHSLGLRYRTHLTVPGNRRRTMDVAFTRARLAVFVDGCFWHSCPDHGTSPRTNSEWWVWKLERTVKRDRDTEQLLASAGWTFVRVWEHEEPAAAACRIRQIYLEKVSRWAVDRAPAADMRR